jgi:two-component system sensor histidine kinase/response regulator
MTASALVADRDRCLAAGMDDYLAKPVNPAELAGALHRWITDPAGAPTTPDGAPDPAPPAAVSGPAAPAPVSRPAAPAAASGPAPLELDDDPIGRRLDELAGDRTEPEEALVRRLVTSFLDRAPRHLTAIGDGYRADDAKTVEDQAHSLKGAAGNIGAIGVMEACRRIEDAARTGELSAAIADDLRTLQLELGLADERLREVLTPA